LPVADSAHILRRARLRGEVGSGLCTGAESIAAAFGRDWYIPISPLGSAIGFFFSIVVGFGFGTYPARRAADLDPVAAISQ